MHLTPTQQRLAGLLADGRPHPRREIHALICDTLDPLSNIRFHIWSLRAKLREAGQDIVCVLDNRRLCYRQVRLLAPSQTQSD